MGWVTAVSKRMAGTGESGYSLSAREGQKCMLWVTRLIFMSVLGACGCDAYDNEGRFILCWHCLAFGKI